MQGGGCNGMKSAFRWLLAAARYASASVMAVVVLLVIAKAVKVLLQPKFLSISVVPGCIFARRISDHPPMLEFQFEVKAMATTSHARMDPVEFGNITAYLFGKDTPPWSPQPVVDCLMFLNPDDVQLMPGPDQVTDRIIVAQVNRDADIIDFHFFDLLYDENTCSEVTMRLDAIVSTSTSSYNRTTTYYCWPLVVCFDQAKAYHQGIVLEDVFGSEGHGNHLI